MTAPSYALVTPAVLDELRRIVGVEHVSVAPADREQHAHDQGFYAAGTPEAVVWPADTEQISGIMRLASAERIAVTPWGAGTSIEGNPIALHGGLLLSLRRMDQIVAVHADDFQVTVQPGIGHKDLNARLARHGLFFAPDPGANASIGGMLANNAAGIRTVRYGAMRDNVLRAQVVLADGRVIDVGSRSVKQSSGYDLLHLLVGSEGTLGIIAEATLKLHPILDQISAAVATFEHVAAAVEAVVALRGSGLDPAALEFVDAASIALLNHNAGLGLPELPTLFLEFHNASTVAAEETLAQAQEICAGLGARSFAATTTPTERQRLWHARNAAYEMMVRAYPGQRLFINDVAVPLSSFPALIGFIRGELERAAVTAFLLGHAGDGNIHVIFPCADEQAYQVCQDINALIVERALTLGGTATGEHGVGIGKARFMRREHGPALDVMLAIKRALDPLGILNPGKIFS
jgi:D-lactate dehydrogenase (cytochrome)